MAVIKYNNYTSIKAIKNRMEELNNPTCSFDFTFHEEGIFPTAMIYVHVKPIHEEDDKTTKEHYRLISILSNLSKVYERIMYN